MPRRYEGMTYWEIVSRQMDFLGREEQLQLKKAKVLVLGCGGIGGAAIEMLARMGVGYISIVDKDTFDVSNINRQIMSSFHTVGESKVLVTKKRIHEINPFVKVKIFEGDFDETNVGKIIGDNEVVIDGLDNIISRVIASRECRRLDVPFIHGAVYASKGQITVFGKKTPSYEDVFDLVSGGVKLTEKIKEKIQRLETEAPPILGPVPNIVGCIQSFEALKLLTGKNGVIWAPRILIFDLIKDDPFKVVRL